MMNRSLYLRFLFAAAASLGAGLVPVSAGAQSKKQSPPAKKKPQPAKKQPPPAQTKPATATTQAQPRPAKMWGDKNYNPEFFDLKPPVSQVLEGERGAVQVLAPVEGRLAHAFYLYRPDRKLPYDPVWDSAYDSYLALHDLHVGQMEANTLTFPTRVPPIVKGQLPRYARGQIWDPLFSPDGRYLLFKYGTPTDPEDGNILYILDTQTQKMRQVPEPFRAQLSYEYISWSPDGKYLACVLGGNRWGEVNVIHGPDTAYIGPLTLYVVDWRAGKWHEVARNDTLRGPFRWAAPHTLVYGMMPTAPPANSDKAPGVKPSRPELYQYSVETQTSRLVMRDGFLPTPSPSGRWVAFFGAENAEAAALPLKEDWPDDPSNVALLVAPLPDSPNSAVRPEFLSAQPWQAKERVVVNNEEKVFPEVFWLPDEKHLITLKQVQWGIIEIATDKFTQINKAEVQLWDLTDALAGKGAPRHKLLTTITAQDFERAQRSPVDGAFRGLHLSEDGKTFYITTSEFIERDPLNGILYLNKTTLKTVDVETGKVTDIVQTTGDAGIDWYNGTTNGGMVPPVPTDREARSSPNS